MCICICNNLLEHYPRLEYDNKVYIGLEKIIECVKQQVDFIFKNNLKKFIIHFN